MAKKHMKASSDRLPAVAECYAELALARLVARELEGLDSRYRLRVSHKPSRGGHDRIVVKTLRGAAEHERIVLFIDYEEEFAARRYTEQLCSGEKRVAYSARGASIIVCKSKKSIHGRSLEVYAVVWKLRSEEVLAAATKLPNDPRSCRRVKNDPDYAKRLLKGTNIPSRVAETLKQLLEET